MTKMEPRDANFSAAITHTYSSYSFFICPVFLLSSVLCHTLTLYTCVPCIITIILFMFLVFSMVCINDLSFGFLISVCDVEKMMLSLLSLITGNKKTNQAKAGW